jgi:hypothetical protein
MMKTDSNQALMAVLTPEDDVSQSAIAGRQGADLLSLPSLEARVDLLTRALFGTRAATAQERAGARLRILDAMAEDLGGKSNINKSDIKNDFLAAPNRAAAKATIRDSNLLVRLADAIREALLWPLTLPVFPGQPMRLAAVSCAVLLVAGGAWTSMWFYAARTTETAIASWIDSEAMAGRDYGCGARHTGGFPLSIEVSCTAPRVKIALSDQSTLEVNAKSLHTVVSVFSPGTLVSNIVGPVSIAGSSQSATFGGNWSLARMILHGQPANPSQVSLLLDNPDFYRVTQGADEHFLLGGRLELDATAAGASVINIAVRAFDVSIPEGGPIVSRPFAAELSAALHNVEGRTPQLFSTRLRDWQARGGRLEVAELRIQQGDSLAIGAGQLRLNDSGHLDGALHMSAAGLYERIARSYILDGGSGARERERLAQTDLGGANIQTRSLANPQSDQATDRDAGLGRERQRQPTMPRQAGSFEIPIRFRDGAVFLGSTDLGNVPPLF